MPVKIPVLPWIAHQCLLGNCRSNKILTLISLIVVHALGSPPAYRREHLRCPFNGESPTFTTLI